VARNLRSGPYAGGDYDAAQYRALSDPVVRKGLSDSAQEPVGGSAEEFTRIVEVLPI
jgi:hypothetical protein